MQREERVTKIPSSVNIQEFRLDEKSGQQVVLVLSSFTIFHTIEGTITFEVDLTHVETKAGDLFFGYPGQRVTQIETSPSRMTIVAINRAFMLQLHRDLFQFRILLPQPLRAIRIPDDIMGTLVPLEESMSREVAENRTVKRQMLSALTLQYLVWIERIYYTQIEHKEEYYPKLISDFYHYLYGQENLEWKVNWFAEKLKVSARHLSRVFKEVTGRLIKSVILEHQLNKAMHRLLFSDKDVKSIAYELNFKSDSYFFAYFKRETGQTPTQFREGGGKGLML